MDLKQLEQEIPFQWRIGMKSKNYPTAMCLGYIDARDAMDLLDNVVGKAHWMCDYKELKGHMYCGIGINVNESMTSPMWVWKWDVGTESNTEETKGESSDAFKRAAVKWGVGRFLYNLPKTTIKLSGINGDPIDENGQRIYDLTKYITNLKKS